jgi:7-cyano-7-deazaguanine synthase
LVSGGIDSAALVAFYLRQRFRVRGYFIDFGQPASRREAVAAGSVCGHFGVALSTVRLRSRVAYSTGEIRGRNAFLILTVVMTTRPAAHQVAIGIHDGTPYYDCGTGFVRDLQTVLDGYAGGAVRLAAPFVTWTKRQIWDFCRFADVPVELTYSCEKGQTRPCGKCSSCKDRKSLDES